MTRVAPSKSRFSRFAGGLRVGPDFFERRGALTHAEPAPRGVVDRMSDLSHPGIDVARVHPDIVPFFEDTAGLELLIRSRWHFPFSLLWSLLRPIMRSIGQFVMPRDEARVLTQVLPLDAACDGRPGARAVIRSYAQSGDVMQAIAYASWESDGVRYMSAAFPLPGGQIAGLLRLDAIAEDDAGRLAVALTSQRDGDDAGIWLLLGPLALPAPLGERIELWAAGMSAAPAELEPRALLGATIVGRHVQRFFGARFATHHYWFRPR
jgi:hypothetical protein